MGKVTKIKEVQLGEVITGKDLFRIKTGLDAVSKLQGVKFAYAVAKNLHIISREIEIFTTTVKPSGDFLKFEKERIALCEQHSKKDDKGKAIIAGAEYVLENRDSFEKCLDILRKDYQIAIDEREIQMKEYAIT